MIRKPLLLISVSALLSGCTMIPDFARPGFPAAPTWQDIPGYATPAGELAAAKVTWREFFKDPALQKVIGIALENNRDLQLAALNIDEARALYRIQRADLIPGLNAGADASYQEQSEEESSFDGESSSTELYNANLELSVYELDLFGKIRSRNQSAINEYLASEQAHAVVKNALIAETANAYLQLLADQKLLNLTRKTLVAQHKSYEILRQSLEKGVATEQDVSRAQTAVETARVNLHLYSRFVAQDKNALFLLMGVPHNEDELPDKTLDDIQLLGNLGPGLPAETLLMRPDIRQAEYLLLARNADIGAARAAFFPSITLTGTYGYASQSLSNLFTSGAAGAWAFAPQIIVPIFHGGRARAGLDLAEIRKEQAIANYEQAIQTAFREVADELAARATLDQQLEAQKRLVAAAQRVYDISDARFKSGIDSFLSVLDAQRELYVFQQNQIQIERQRLANLVNLYRVLGGGSN